MKSRYAARWSCCSARFVCFLSFGGFSALHVGKSNIPYMYVYRSPPTTNACRRAQRGWSAKGPPVFNVVINAKVSRAGARINRRVCKCVRRVNTRIICKWRPRARLTFSASAYFSMRRIKYALNSQLIPHRRVGSFRVECEKVAAVISVSRRVVCCGVSRFRRRRQHQLFASARGNLCFGVYCAWGRL